MQVYVDELVGNAELVYSTSVAAFFRYPPTVGRESRQTVRPCIRAKSLTPSSCRRSNADWVFADTGPEQAVGSAGGQQFSPLTFPDGPPMFNDDIVSPTGQSPGTSLDGVCLAFHQILPPATFY